MLPPCEVLDNALGEVGGVTVVTLIARVVNTDHEMVLEVEAQFGQDDEDWCPTESLFTSLLL